MASQRSRRRRLLLAGGTIGFGFGAVLDVVIFHQILQTHHLLSGFYDPYTYDGVRTNVMFDGLFTAGMLAITAIGFAMLWRVVNGTDARLSTRALVGSTVLGAGAFNVFDGIVDHYVLDLHNVVHGTEAWNPHWVVVSVLMLGLGAIILRSADGAEQRTKTQSAD
ncbi:DUF2243 domain-containing protein [Halopiger xanaduensis]|uniref:DUF2243 domain-containing protein n=1 Tax=Halopiger xanaduensis (strain DSM 18323 / JCM 14033 / SH-6) TaxID=797210 RepID=F8D9S6_HALXS|nr:DUF2243 domain-containing protein [Halopiger xanaduensis]AEH37795.1 Protein of unknown function DUF2243, membrane [Halopiger xanaduensis SH-6]